MVHFKRLFCEDEMPVSVCPLPSATPELLERRRWQRSSICLEAFCQYKNPGNEEVFSSGQIVDVSLGGCRLMTSQRMEPATVFRIGVADGEDGLFTLLMARVVHISPRSDGKWAVGCTFTPKLREEILTWMEGIGRN
jgi:c-di-GMP-binding flagellar brake protein YcgR